ncbi:hypothetical protein Q649_01263 [Bartonella quintana JK 73]|uniref:Uncharacterized protein n=1 Tax=Bartonella quintana JK 73 TaxID=1402976 RepID=W3U0A7_BARQI|nr:hypothetical protein [Bartonella quintana]ETS14612.1 hypothetical protein Q650_01254 [Bartonella quintana JK 73rel]ETS16299.1 hypothetical protein Q649_01263 [Bartonella quintana JK 73]
MSFEAEALWEVIEVDKTFIIQEIHFTGNNNGNQDAGESHFVVVRPVKKILANMAYEYDSMIGES